MSWPLIDNKFQDFGRWENLLIILERKRIMACSKVQLFTAIT